MSMPTESCTLCDSVDASSRRFLGDLETPPKFAYSANEAAAEEARAQSSKTTDGHPVRILYALPMDRWGHPPPPQWCWDNRPKKSGTPTPTTFSP